MFANRKQIAYYISFCIALLCLQNPAQGQIRAGVSYLKIAPGTRQLGLAGALTGSVDEMSAIYANPGATGFLREWQWSASYTRWIPDVYDASLLYGRSISLPWSRNAHVALGMTYLGIKDFDSTNGRAPFGQGNELLATLSIGQPLSFISQWFSLGGNVKYFRSSLDQFDASALAFDAGLLMRTPKFGFLKTGLGIFDEVIFSAGVAVTQLGGALHFNTLDTPLPKTVRAGVALNTGSHLGLQFQIAADYRRIRDEEPFFAVGTELSWQQVLYWRGGYRFEDNNILGHVALGLSLGLDDLWASLPGKNNALRLDLAKSDDNIFFASPARGTVSHFPIRPQAFAFEYPLPDAILQANDVSLKWQDSRDPDLYDEVNYLLLADQNRTNIEQILARLENQNRTSLVEVFRDSTRTFSAILAHRIEQQAAALLTNLLCGDYFWSVVAFDKDRHFRVVEHHGENIARFSVGAPDLTIEEMTPGMNASACERVATIVVANKGKANANFLSLFVYNKQKLTAHLVDSTVLTPGMRVTFEKVAIGTICENESITAWINQDLVVPECDTTNNRLQQLIGNDASHDLQITKSADRQVVKPGEKINYTLVVQNNSCCEARDVVVTDQLPIFVKAADFRTPFPKDSTDSHSLTWNLGELAANASVTIKYAAQIEPFTVHINFRNDRFRWNGKDLIDYAKAQQDLDILAARLIDLLRNHEALRLNIVGYTSSPGSARYNERLSSNRANTIKLQLIQKLKAMDSSFDEKRVSSEGRGEKRVFRKYVNDTTDSLDSAGRVVISRRVKQEANRRVEIEFFNLPEIVNRCSVESKETELNMANNRSQAAVRIQ